MKDMGCKLLTVKAAAKLISLAPATLYRWKGIKLPYIRLGRSIKFSLSDLETFIKNNKISPKSQAAAETKVQQKINRTKVNLNILRENKLSVIKSKLRITRKQFKLSTGGK